MRDHSGVEAIEKAENFFERSGGGIHTWTTTHCFDKGHFGQYELIVHLGFLEMGHSVAQRSLSENMKPQFQRINNAQAIVRYGVVLNPELV